MASVHKVSIYQQARDKIETDISGIIQCLNQKKESLFREIAVLENEFKIKQQQNLNSLRKLESLKAHTEELGNNHLSEIQGRLTQELQTGIDKINQEMKALTVEYRIEVDWGGRIHGMKEMIKEFSFEIIPNTVSHDFHLQDVPPSKKAKKKSKQNAFFSEYYCNDEINDLLKDESRDYLFLSDVKVLSSRLFNVYNDIKPNVKQFAHPGTHLTEKMICLEGTIPVNYKGSCYNIPITIWLPKQFPKLPPIPRVTPTANMSINASKYVDNSGTVYLTYLHEWTRGSSDLCDMVQTMSVVFSEVPPVFAKPPQPPQPHMV